METIGRLIIDAFKYHNLKVTDILCADLTITAETRPYADFDYDDDAYEDSLVREKLLLPIGYNHKELKEFLLTEPIKTYYDDTYGISPSSIIWLKDGGWFEYNYQEINGEDCYSFGLHHTPIVPEYLLKK